MNLSKLSTWAWEHSRDNKWTIWSAILCCFGVNMVVSEVLGGLIAMPLLVSFILTYTLGTMFEINKIRYYIDYIRGYRVDVNSLFEAGDINFFRYLLVSVLYCTIVGVSIVFFIIPGVYYALTYSMYKFLQSFPSNNKLNCFQILELSRKMMKGHRIELLLLICEIITLVIGSFFTLGILLIWVVPFAKILLTKFFLDVKESYERENGFEYLMK